MLDSIKEATRDDDHGGDHDPHHRSRSLHDNSMFSPPSTDPAARRMLTGSSDTGCKGKEFRTAKMIVDDQSKVCGTHTQDLSNCVGDCIAEEAKCVTSATFFKQTFPGLFEEWETCVTKPQASCTDPCMMEEDDDDDGNDDVKTCGLSKARVDAWYQPDFPLFRAGVTAEACIERDTKDSCTIGDECTWKKRSSQCEGSFYPFADLLGLNSKINTLVLQGEKCAALETCAGVTCQKTDDGCATSEAATANATADLTAAQTDCKGLAQDTCTGKCTWSSSTSSCKLKFMHELGLLMTPGKPLYELYEKSFGCSKYRSEDKCSGICAWDVPEEAALGLGFRGNCTLSSEAAVKVFLPPPEDCTTAGARCDTSADCLGGELCRCPQSISFRRLLFARKKTCYCGV